MIKNVFKISISIALLAVSCNNSDDTKNITVNNDSLSGNKDQVNFNLGVNDDSIDNGIQNNIEEEKYYKLEKVFKRLAKKPSYFTINNSRDTVIECREGTLLSIPANAFLKASNESTVSGKVNIVVKEFYKVSDMLIAGLSTTSDDKLLETGGMIQITATSNGDSCILKPNKNITIGMPKNDAETIDGMQLFNGLHANNEINWLPNNTIPGLAQRWRRSNKGLFEERIFFNSEFVFPDEMPKTKPMVVNTKPENLIAEVQMTLRDLVGQNGVFTKRASGFIDTLGNLHSYKIDSKIQKVVFKEIFSPTTYKDMKVNVPVDFSISFFSKINQDYFQKLFKMGKGNPDSLVTVTAKLIPTIKITSNERIKKMNNSFITVKQYKILKKRQLQMHQDYEIKLQQLRLNEESKLAKQEKNGMADLQLAQNYFLLSTPGLGWINCDRFYNAPEKIDYFVELKENTNLLMVFNSIKSIIAPDNNGVFHNTPKGEKITLVGLKTENGKLMMAFHETVISEKPFGTLDFKAVTIKEYKAKLEELNRI